VIADPGHEAPARLRAARNPERAPHRRTVRPGRGRARRPGV